MVAINEILTSCCDATKRRDRGGRCVENGNIPNGTTDSLWQGWQTTEENFYRLIPSDRSAPLGSSAGGCGDDGPFAVADAPESSAGDR